MEDFSQSRGDDDLFDDEIIPLEDEPRSPNQTTQQPVPISSEPPPGFLPGKPARQTPTAPTHPPSQATRGRDRGRGRGPSNAQPRKPNGLASSKYAPKPTPPVSTQDQPSPSLEPPQNTTTDTLPPPVPTTSNTETTDTSSAPAPPSNSTPTTTTATEPPTGPTRPPAVRGDRTHTGGTRRSKLSEAELASKLQAAKERSQTLAAAHARAQADQADFEERERVALLKRREENVRKVELEKEREVWRERKMKSRGGREWDEGKSEDRDGGGRGQRGDRGDAYRWKEGEDLSMYEWHDERGQGRGRGRGRGRGGRDGVGRGRGGLRNGDGLKQSEGKAQEEFPALPGKTDVKEVDLVQRPKQLRVDSETEPGASWADQVESSEANT